MIKEGYADPAPSAKLTNGVLVNEFDINLTFIFGWIYMMEDC